MHHVVLFIKSWSCDKFLNSATIHPVNYPGTLSYFNCNVFGNTVVCLLLCHQTFVCHFAVLVMSILHQWLVKHIPVDTAFPWIRCTSQWVLQCHFRLCIV